MNRFKILIFFLLSCFPAALAQADGHPNLLLAQRDLEGLREHSETLPMLAQSLDLARASVDPLLEGNLDVPEPRDAGGGYTHERHKKNGIAIYNAGLLYQITRDKKYAELARDLLLRYAELFPTLGPHPKHKHQAPGRIFWQVLNDAVWLVYTAQGYDAVFEYLPAADRQRVEKGLLRPMAAFLSEGSPETFNKIHNHGTWAAAAVGMTGYVLGERELVGRALLGLDKSGEGGFLRQLDALFSPDGYYTEGPYYQRYALMPFVLFARAIERNDPGRKIFEYREGVLLKAVYAAINLTYNNRFFPINDALKDKGLDTIEMVHAVDIAYAISGDSGLLDIAARQGQVTLSGDGLAVARAMARGEARPFAFRSQLLRDGTDGKGGTVAVLRSNRDQALVFKAASQGMGHGHFDRLNWLFYDRGREIVSDYGAARFLNVESKNGGAYLPENSSWAKHTIAHNTLVVDGKSHFDGNWRRGAEASPQLLQFYQGQGAQLVSARETHAYPGVDLVRSMLLLDIPEKSAPLVVDLLKVNSRGKHRYDLPLYFQGHITNIRGVPGAKTERLEPLGKENGYQHLWLKARLRPESPLVQVTWLEGDSFYTYSSLADSNRELLFVELGANDPDFNLRRENGLVLRQPQGKDAVFLSVLEPHGVYNGTREYTLDTRSAISGLEHFAGDGADLIRISFRNGGSHYLGIAHRGNEQSEHSVAANGRVVRWRGPFKRFSQEAVDGTEQ